METPVIPFAVRAVLQRNRDHVANRDKRELKVPMETGSKFYPLTYVVC